MVHCGLSAHLLILNSGNRGSVDYEQQNAWNVKVWIPWRICLQNIDILKRTVRFLLKPTIPNQFRTLNVRETLYCRFRCVWNVKFVKKRRFVHQNTCYKTVLAGLARHARDKNVFCYGKYDALTCVFDKLKSEVRIMNNRTRETWHLGFRDAYFAKTYIFWRNTRVLIETENFGPISDPKR